ncbi:MAG: fatty acid CoA ligase family protein [Planctomycetota bacterium]|nr:fatty acid CoA ligase family protein [Planctomycetota bacterium]
MSNPAPPHSTIVQMLHHASTTRPDAIAIAEPTKRFDAQSQRIYRTVTFAQLSADCRTIATGLVAAGVRPGMRLALMVPPSIDFITLVFALLESGAVQILIDPGMRGRNLLRSLQDAEPEGFVGIPKAQMLRRLFRHRFPKAKLNVTVGRSVWPGGKSLDQIRSLGAGDVALPQLQPTDSAAIIFTTGSTGPSKGVHYHHRNFAWQAVQIQERYNIQAGEIDVPCFPLFGLFNAAMGVTTVIPRMNASRPAKANPANIVEAITQWQATQSFASPAVWDKVGPYCQEKAITLPTLRRVLSAGAPVPARVLSAMTNCLLPEAEMHTPYGATEALPVSTITASEVLQETWPATEKGRGVCVGKRFSGIEWRVIQIVDGPIKSIDDSVPLPAGDIGELIVRGPVVTTEYVTRREANATAKIADSSAGGAVWHRMGDCGYLDEQDRFWFCGRVAHRVVTAERAMYTIPCEAIFNTHRRVRRSALVAVQVKGVISPAIVIEPKKGEFPYSGDSHVSFYRELLLLAARHEHTRGIQYFLFRRHLPVDIRHNAKIFREKLAVWATRQLRATIE